jgi:hypothetical protein
MVISGQQLHLFISWSTACYPFYRDDTNPMDQTPDRFIPRRRPGSAREVFELSRWDRLTDQEKLVRSNTASPDPFRRRSN